MQPINVILVNLRVPFYHPENGIMALTGIHGLSFSKSDGSPFILSLSGFLSGERAGNLCVPVGFLTVSCFFPGREFLRSPAWENEG